MGQVLLEVPQCLSWDNQWVLSEGRCCYVLEERRPIACLARNMNRHMLRGAADIASCSGAKGAPFKQPDLFQGKSGPVGKYGVHKDSFERDPKLTLPNLLPPSPDGNAENP